MGDVSSCQLDILASAMNSDTTLPFWVVQLLSFTNGIYTLVSFSRQKHNRDPSVVSLLNRSFAIGLMLVSAHKDWIKLRQGLLDMDNLIMSVAAAVLATSGNLAKAVAALAMHKYGHEGDGVDAKGKDEEKLLQADSDEEEDVGPPSLRKRLNVFLRHVFSNLLFGMYAPLVFCSTVIIVLAFMIYAWIPLLGGLCLWRITYALAVPVEHLKNLWQGHVEEVPYEAFLAAEKKALKKIRKLNGRAQDEAMRKRPMHPVQETQRILFCVSMTPLMCLLALVFVRWAPPNNEGYWEALRITWMERGLITQVNQIAGDVSKSWKLVWLVI